MRQFVDEEEIQEIFARITEEYENPVPIGGRCESHIFYRASALSDHELDLCANFVADRILKVIHPLFPQVLLKLPGGFTFFAERLSAVLSEESRDGKEIPLEQYFESKFSNGYAEKFKNRHAILVTDVITTARSSLEAHTRATLKGVKVLCWAALIDRTFGPGPVPVVSSFVGAPVRLLTQIG